MSIQSSIKRKTAPDIRARKNGDVSAAMLADKHEVPKKQAEVMLGDMVAMTARHLKKGDKVRSTGSVSSRCANGPPGWGASHW